MPFARASATLRLAFASFASLLVAINLGIAIHHAHNPTSSLTNDGMLNHFAQSKSVRERPPHDPPPLDSIVQGWNITGNASWLLNFAIVGFAKCGTSSLMFHLRSHPEVRIFEDERCDMSYNRQAVLIRDLYTNFSNGAHFVRGIKCPLDLENDQLALPNYQKVFPQTSYIVGIRHPVLWFESFYNFRVHNKFPMPPPHNLIGRCRRGNFNVCTYRGNFHLFLSNLGKTPLTTRKERELMGQYEKLINPRNVSQPVFLYEVSQLSDPDEARAEQLHSDLQSFLHLQEPISPMIWFRPGIKHSSKDSLEAVNALKIDICAPEYDDIRSVLQQQSINASLWIRNYFVHSPSIVVSSKEHFINAIMKSWERDPCLDRATSARKSSTGET